MYVRASGAPIWCQGAPARSASLIFFLLVLEQTEKRYVGVFFYLVLPRSRMYRKRCRFPAVSLIFLSSISNIQQRDVFFWMRPVFFLLDLEHTEKEAVCPMGLRAALLTLLAPRRPF